MIKKQIDPDLLVMLDTEVDLNFWENLPEARATRRALSETAGTNLSIMDHIVFEDHLIPEAGNNPNLRIRVYRPETTSGPVPALLWVHGGGYVVGSIDAEVSIMQRLVDEVGCIVVAVEYRLAPEHPYPMPLDDCYQALSWLFANTDKLGINADKVAIAGISAGAGLAAGLALMARDRGDYKIIFQLLLCPMLDDRNEQPSTHMDLTGISWDRLCNQNGWQAYLAGPYQEGLHSYAAPSRVENLSNLPPAYISVGSLDLFLDEDMQYARRLLEAQVAAELHVFPGGIHAFEYFVPSARLSSRAHYLNYEILKHAFA